MILIRAEKTADHAAIYALTDAAFAPMKFSDGTEPDCINQLRNDGDLMLSLVAENDGQTIAHVAFSPATIGKTGGKWLALGPVAVLPEWQRNGIGTKLIKEGLTKIRNTGFDGCVLTGNPNYYCRFGFQSSESMTYRDTPTKNVMWLAFGNLEPNGELIFSPGLE